MTYGKSTITIVLLGLLVVGALVYIVPEGYQYLTQDQSRKVGGPGDAAVSVNPPLNNPTASSSFSYSHTIHGIPDGAFVRPAAAGMWEDGGFFVVDLSSTEGYVTVFDAEGNLRRRFAPLGSNGMQELVTAKLGPDGLLYLLDTSSTVYAYRHDGSFSHRIALPGNTAQQIQWVKSLAVDSEGTLYLLALDTVLVVDRNGQLVRRYTGEGKDWLGVQPSEFYLGPSDLCLSSDGMLYISDTINYRVMALDKEGNVARTIPVPELNGNLPRLGDLVIGSGGQVYVLDHQASAIREYTESEGWSTAAKLPAGIDSGWEEYYNLRAGLRGALLITDRLNSGIWQLLPGSTSATRWAGTGVKPLFAAPKGIAVSSDGSLLALITDPASHTDQPALVLLRKMSTDYAAAWSLSMENPKQVAFTSEGSLIVLDEVTIRHYSSNGELLNVFGEEGRGEGQFAISESLGGRRGPQGFACVGNKLWIADTFNHRVLVFSLDGNLQETLILPEDLYPTSVAPIAGRLWVLDAYAGELHLLGENGESQRVVGKPGTGDGQFGVLSDMDWFDGPHALLLIGDRLLVADTYNHRVHVFNSQGSFIESLGEGGSGIAQFYFPGSLAADDSGKTYVADSNNHRVQVFIPR